jgi:hypothetical protein
MLFRMAKDYDDLSSLNRFLPSDDWPKTVDVCGTEVTDICVLLVLKCQTKKSVTSSFQYFKNKWIISERTNRNWIFS